MPDGLVGLVNQNEFGIWNRDSIFVESESRKAVVISVRQNRIWPRVCIADDCAGFDPSVIDENEMIRLEARMKRDAEQAGIVPALTLVVDVENQFLL